MFDNEISLDYHDVVVSRVTNGWILKIQEEDSEGNPHLQVSVFEDTEYIEQGPAQSLANCLWEAFQGYARSKRSGGISFEVKESVEEEEERDGSG